MFFCKTCGSEIKIPVGICPVCGSPTPYDNASEPQAGRQPAAQNVVFEPEMPTTVIPPEDIPDLMQNEYGMMGGPAGQRIPPVMGRTANRTGTSQTGRNTKHSGTSSSGGGRDNASTGGGNTGQAAPLRSGNGKDPSGEKPGLPWGKIILISLLVAGCLAGGFFGVRALLKKDEPKETERIS